MDIIGYFLFILSYAVLVQGQQMKVNTVPYLVQYIYHTLSLFQTNNKINKKVNRTISAMCMHLLL